MQSFPEDLYDDDDFIVEKKRSELRREMIAHIIMGMGFGVMLTVALASLVAWVLGVWLKYSTILEAYTLTELLELNDLTEEDCLEYLLSTKFIELPEVLPIEFDD